ncbi:MAG: LysR family transcriptional regulator [Burkholderiales bacterium]
MDKLRAMEYLVRVVEAGSFAAAARELDVSPPAVTKLIGALERKLGAPLLRRDSRHLSLTRDGEQFLPVCASVLADLRATEARLSANRTRASGKLIVGLPLIVGQHCVAPYLPEFLSRHPGLTLDLRLVKGPKDPLAALVDVLVSIGWPEETDMVAKCIAQTRLVTCASPTYWEAHGLPQDPDELRHHACAAVRLPAESVVLDVWKYRRGGEVRTVAIEPRIVSDNHFWNLEAAVRGVGVVRYVELTARPFVEQGLLQPALEDWEALEPPNIYLMYRRSSRSTARVRAFMDFATELFADLEASQPDTRQTKLRPEPMPAWFRSKWVGPLTRRIQESRRPSARTRKARD